MNSWLRDWCVCLSDAASGGCSDRNGGCEHLCVTGYRGHFYCRCMTGYELMEDDKSCRGQWAIVCWFVSVLTLKRAPKKLYT